MAKIISLALLKNIIKKFPFTCIQCDRYKFANGFAQKKPNIIRAHQIKDSQSLGSHKKSFGQNQ